MALSRVPHEVERLQRLNETIFKLKEGRITEKNWHVFVRGDGINWNFWAKYLLSMAAAVRLTCRLFVNRTPD